ncbi:MAG: hypothetical protein Ct9H300mP28_26270 [Pseudomonadota bacterium]|nr:MAG: hypothetical protein Ct9H300mP28_26270 [Pseudomonadota bacterium]
MTQVEFSEYLPQNQILSMFFFPSNERKFKKPFLLAWLVSSILPWFDQHFPRQLLNFQCFLKQDHSLSRFLKFATADQLPSIPIMLSKFQVAFISKRGDLISRNGKDKVR